MNKVYNNKKKISTNLQDFFKEINLPLPEYRHNLLSELIISAIIAESGVISDITKKSFSFNDIHDESLQRKIRRFFDSNKFKPYKIFDTIIKEIISNYNIKHDDNRIHIVIDHMYCNDKFVTLMFTLRIGKQGIPLWFRCYKDKSNPDVFDTNLIIKGIDYVINLFKDKNYNLVFLADRWFPNTKILTHIENKNCTYVFRTKKEHKIKYYDTKENHYIWKPLSQIQHRKYGSKIFENIEYTFRNPINTNIVLGKSHNIDEPWILVTNGDPKRAVKDYNYRFGAIETLFKNQKTNGFYIESTKIKNISSFIGMYLIINISIVWLTILGSDYVKNKHHYSKYIKIRDTKKIKSGALKRIMSLFNLGLTLFNKLIDNDINMRLKCNFVLYDV